MNEEQVLNLIKSRLTIELERDDVEWEGSGVRVLLKLDDETISTDFFILKDWSNY